MPLEGAIKIFLIGALGFFLRYSKSVLSARDSTHCDPSMPYLSVGSFNLTERNHDLKVEKHDLILIYVSADLELCPHCCKAESMLRELD